MRAPFTLPLLLCVACNGPGASNTAPTNNRYVLPIGPRFQWEENNGYCGETSLISAGLYYGQYGSQYDARAYASDGADQSRPTSQLLLGVNEDEAATAMHLEVTRWHGDTPEDFLAWVKQNFLLGYPVIIGVFNNENRLYGETAADAGDAEYDHIVPVTGIGSDHPISDPSYHADDTLTFSDNGLVGDDTPSGSTYFNTFAFDAFLMTRAQANAADAPYYALSKETANYGIAVTGVADSDGATLPVSVETRMNYESPEIEDGGTERPQATPLELTVTVSNLAPGQDYTLYRYDTIASVPDGQFNAHAAAAEMSWPVHVETGSTWSVTETVLSSDVAVYRAVPDSAD